MSVVYYVGARAVGRIKIGTTKDIRARMSRLRAQSIDNLELVYAEPGGLREERARHELFHHLRRHGEWFEWTKDIDDWIDTVKESRQRMTEWFGSEFENRDVFIDAIESYSRTNAFAMPLRVRIENESCGPRVAGALERVARTWLRSRPDDAEGAYTASISVYFAGVIPGTPNYGDT